MASQLSRASFLRGNIFGTRNIVRPPWALSESAFTDQCTRCNDCITACPENIIEAGRGGFPVISFANGECTFCGDCHRTCEPGALHASSADARPWDLTVTLGADCLGEQGIVCRLCEDQCEARAIRFPKLGGAGAPKIDRQSCTGCGACIAPCPVDAIAAQPQQHPEVAA